MRIARIFGGGMLGVFMAAMLGTASARAATEITARLCRQRSPCIQVIP
jgi:hypothetical protein